MNKISVDKESYTHRIKIEINDVPLYIEAKIDFGEVTDIQTLAYTNVYPLLNKEDKDTIEMLIWEEIKELKSK